MNKTNQEAFTLIELAVSILVSGILSSISLAIFTEYKDKAYQIELTMAMRDLATASEATYTELEAALSAKPYWWSNKIFPLPSK